MGRRIHKWVRRAFLLWAVVAMAWLANSVRTQGVPSELMRSGGGVLVEKEDGVVAFLPEGEAEQTGVVFLCGSGISPWAYTPFLRPIAAAGHPVFVVGLPWRFAPLDSHKEAALQRAAGVMQAHPGVERWVVAGHSLGGALAARFARRHPERLAGLVLVGTTHPKEQDLSALAMPVAKVYAGRDGVAPPERVLANRGRLPEHTRWVVIEGGNHSQFGHYGRQLMDGKASVDRATQQARTRAVLLEALAEARPEPES